MGVIGISLIVASVVWVILRPPPWLTPLQVLLRWRGAGGTGTITGPDAKAKADERGQGSHHGVEPGRRAEPGTQLQNRTTPTLSSDHDQHQSQPSLGRRDASSASSTQLRDAVSMPPPPSRPIIKPPILIETPTLIEPPTIAEPDEQTTPKATPAIGPSIPVPTFSLDNAPLSSAPSRPSAAALARSPAAQGPTLSAIAPTSLGSMMPPPPPGLGRMPPPPSSGRMPPPAGRPPSLAQFPAANSAQRARGPTPNRGPSSLGTGLAPPPSHTSKPSKPSRKVLLTPGHSPLDWARISGPNADLRGVGPSTSYLRVTPSMLKRMTGRKGKDAWMALNGKVYNVTPYAEYHPGGVPELMRGAGRDATKLYGEIHPWVNYETMLAACLVGLLVEESEGSTGGEMDQMD
ncbi:hypothetical protein EDB81DRAFT_393710 [Dactylonectria macrodidyma]|uniref:Cytochrome b5 heme-binding domain-containing protein n=1 Tax=Dactylonectria macrodidyma TaxID=307937 RepID=A0A9P9FAY8_9HYPO|nr:hypothetical protein EDB81DRAFT_393710 [Dactylonectria macrodidyma]